MYEGGTLTPTLLTGWWTLTRMMNQAEDLRDVLRVVAPPRLFQYIAFYDNSTTHNKREDLTLSVSSLGAKWGGKKRGLRDSVMIEGCIGDESSCLWYIPNAGTGEWAGGPLWLRTEKPGAKKMDCRLHVGDTDHGRFQPDDPPPFYQLDAPRYDRDMTNTEKRVERERRVVKKAKKLADKRKKLRDPDVTLTDAELEEFDENANPLIVPGFVGKPKGARVHVWLRGHWREGMTGKMCFAILKQQPDFKLETSRLFKSWLTKGHGAQSTIPGTPETVTVEYAWGTGKYEFRSVTHKSGPSPHPTLTRIPTHIPTH